MDRVREIERRLRDAFTPEALEVIDDSAAHAGHEGARGGAGHFAVVIVSARFQGQPTLARHRAVYTALHDLMPAHVHALNIRALTPDEL